MNSVLGVPSMSFHSKRENIVGSITGETAPRGSTLVTEEGRLKFISPVWVLYQNRDWVSSTRHQEVSVEAEHMADMNFFS